MSANSEATHATTVTATKGQRPPWKVFPIERYEEVSTRYGKSNIKVIYLIRHAEGTHNVQNNYSDPSNIDARLTVNGLQQCESRHGRILEGMPILSINGGRDNGGICVLTSPMTRCIQTALHTFQHLLPDAKDEAETEYSIPFIALESLRETVNYNCDRRRAVSILAREFPQIDFSLYHDTTTDDEPSFCPEDDAIWNSYIDRGIDDNTAKESAELHVVARRGYEALDFLQRRPERQIVVSTHSAFLRCILNWGHKAGEGMTIGGRDDQRLDDRLDRNNYPLFKYSGDGGFEEYMRRDFKNCELRSFCMLIQGDTTTKTED